MKPKVLVLAYFAMNFGDDLFLKILFDRYPNVKWDLLTANRNYKKIFSNYKNVNILYTYRDINIEENKYNLFFKINDLFFDYKKYNALVNIGGSIFKQSPAWEMKLREREYLNSKFKQKNKKTYVIGANFGPFYNELFIDKYRQLIAEFDNICFWDHYSYNLFKELNNIRVAPIILTLDIGESEQIAKSVWFSLLDVDNIEGLEKYSQQYYEKMIELICIYLEKGYKVKLFSFCLNEGDLKINELIKSCIETKNHNDLVIVNYIENINEFLNEFKSCEVIIGTRFHSIILAFLFNQSVFPLIYSDKTYNMLKDMNMENNYCCIKDIYDLDLNEVITKASHNKLKNRNILNEAHKQFEELDEYLKVFCL